MKIFVDGAEQIGTTAAGVAVAGDVVHGVADSGDPIKTGGIANTGVPSAVDDQDRVNAFFDEFGTQAIKIVRAVNGTDLEINTLGDAKSTSGLNYLFSMATGYGLGPDGSLDHLRTASDAAPGLGALNVAPIGGDITLRASAIAGEATGTSTAVDDLGWVKSFTARLDVTAVPSGGTPTLNVRIQTHMASGDWQDIAAFAQATGSTTAEVMDWGPWNGETSQIVAEGATGFVADRFFADQDAAMAVSTVRAMNLGDSLRIQWTFAAGGSTGDYTFAVDGTFHS